MSDRNVYAPLGSSNRVKEKREQNDYYATDPIAVKHLLNLEEFSGSIREPSCGEGHLSKSMIEKGFDVKSSDLIDRGYGKTMDFFSQKEMYKDTKNIITNPPYKFGLEYVSHGLDLLPRGGKMALFLKLQFLEGKKRKKLFQATPPYKLYVSSSRIKCAKGGDFNIGSSAIAYGWYVWIKGYKGKTSIERFN